MPAIRGHKQHIFVLQDKPSRPAPPESNSSDENIYKSVQVSQTAKGERIKELKQQVDSLQNVILQVSIVRKFNHAAVALERQTRA